MAGSNPTSNTTLESVMNPCAVSFRPKADFVDILKKVVFQDLSVNDVQPSMVSLTPPSEERMQGHLLPSTNRNGLSTQDGKHPEYTNRESSEHVHQPTNGQIADATPLSPANSPPINAFASMTPTLGFVSGWGPQSSHSQIAGDIHSTRRNDTPLLKNKRQDPSRSLAISIPKTNPILPPYEVSNDELQPQTEYQQPEHGTLPSSPLDMTIGLYGHEDFHSELHSIDFAQSFAPQHQGYENWGPPCQVSWEQVSLESTDLTQTLGKPYLESEGEYKDFIQIEPSPSSTANIKSNAPSVYFGEITSQSSRIDNQDVRRPRYKLVDTMPSYQRGGQDKKPRTMDIIDPIYVRKAAGLVTTLPPAQSANGIEGKADKVVDGSSLNIRSATIQKVRPQLGDGIANTLSVLMKQRHPPANAPTAPASLRRSQSTTQRASSLLIQPSETGTWSQSKRWISQESRERAAFQKMKLHLQYMGADKSPAIPQSPAELTAFRLEATSIKSRKLTRDIFKRQEQSQRKREGGHDDTKLRCKPVLFNHKEFDDVLSPFFAAESWFNKLQPGGPEAQAKWPTMAEFKEDGDNRALRHGRYFPLPRIEVIAIPIQEHEHEQDHAYNLDGGIRRQKRIVKCDSRFILPVSSDLSPPRDTPADCEEARLPRSFYCLVDSIGDLDKDDEETENYK